MACFYAKERDHQPECRAHRAAVLPGHPPPPPSPLLSTSSTVLILADTTHKGLMLAASSSSRALSSSSSSDPPQPGCSPVRQDVVSVRPLTTVSHLWNTGLLLPLYPLLLLLLLGWFIQGAHQTRASAFSWLFLVFLEAGGTSITI